MKRFAILLTLILTVALTASPAQAVPLGINLQSFATGLSAPIDITNTGITGDTRLFVTERAGKVRLIDGSGTLSGTAFIDITSSVNQAGEGGLLGIAFHPSYASNGFFYLGYYAAGRNIKVTRYTATGTPSSATTANPATALDIITIAHPNFDNHVGGDVAFGPDGFLYVSTGDGGSGDDPPNNAQNKESLLGKILRLDINSTGGGNNYTSPSTNPFFGATAGRDEIWSYGLRNPFRIGFDRLNGDLYIGDVGQGAREEVSYQAGGTAGGLNYGWRCFEGSIPNPNTSVQCSLSNHTPPIGQYSQGSPRAITGGTVYRGTSYPALAGYYVFADFYSGNFSTLLKNGSTFEQTLQTTFSGRNLVGFGENKAGELFVSDISNGTIYQITASANAPLYRMWSGGATDHFYTVNASERAAGGYVQEGIVGYLPTVATAGATPLYRLWSGRGTDHFYTVSAAERDGASGGGYAQEGNAGFIFTTQVAGSTPLYRLWNGRIQDHFYTASSVERDAAVSGGGYASEGIVGYLKTAP